MVFVVVNLIIVWLKFIQERGVLIGRFACTNKRIPPEPPVLICELRVNPDILPQIVSYHDVNVLILY